MVNYENGKIYKIEPVIEHPEEDIYIGSTTKQYLSQRINEHRHNYKRWKEGKTNYTSSFGLFNRYGVNNCKIYLLEMVKATTKDELTSREGHYIRTLKCVNIRIPYRTETEYNKQYYMENKDRLKLNMKHYNKENQEKIRLNKKQYQEDHKEEIKAYQKQYREKMKLINKNN